MKRIDINNLIVDVDMNDSEESFYTAYDALDDGYDKTKPIVIDENGFIEDGNHRYVTFRDAGRLDEISIIMILPGFEIKIKYLDFTCKAENTTDDKYYPFIETIGKWIQK